MRNLKAIAVGMVCVLCPVQVHAVQIGTFEVTPTATLQEKYDDNITSSETNKRDDFITLLSVGLKGERETKTDALTLKGTITQEIFAQEEGFNNLSQLLSARYKKEISEYDRLTINNSFTHADSPINLQDEFGNEPGRYDYFRNYLYLGMEHDFTERLMLKTKYEMTYYDPSQREINHSILNRPGAQLEYSFGPKTTGSLFYDYYNKYFKPGGTVIIHSLAAGARRFLTEQLYVDLKAGPDFIQTADNDETVKPNFYVALVDRINETTDAKISFSKSHEPGNYNSDLFDNWQIDLYGGKLLTQRLYLNLGGFVGSGEYASGVEEDFKGAYAGLIYEFTDNLKGTVNYTFSRRDASIAGQDYDRNTVAMGVTVDF